MKNIIIKSYIVFFSDGSKHSAWTSKAEAAHQLKTLKNYGYKGCYMQQIDHTYENGYYFV